ncbi:Arc family DNA-binding protein [Gluconobacter aidae]
MSCGSHINHGEKHVKHAHPQFKLRIPLGLKRWLETEATSNHRSISGQIIYLLEETKKASDQPASNPDASTSTL